MKRCEQIGMEDKYAVHELVKVFDGKTLVGIGASQTEAKKICNALNLQHRIHRGCMGCGNQGDLCFKCSRRPVYQDFYTRKC